jgi:hypothetical protein
MSDKRGMKGNKLSEKYIKFLNSRQTEVNVDNVQNLDNQNDEYISDDDSNDGIPKNVKTNVSEGNVLVGAFPIPGIRGETSNLDERILAESMLYAASPAQPAQDSLSHSAITAELVVEDKSQPIPEVHAVPLRESQHELTRRSFLTKRSCKIYAGISFFLLIGVITSLIILIRGMSKGLKLNSEAILVLDKLKPLLTATSRQELASSESVPSKALRWLLEQSNFQEYTFERQVQRYAMAALYYSANGKTWTKHDNWLTNSDECTWFQAFSKDICDGGILRQLSLPSNNLMGPLPKDIGLLSSLKYLDFYDNTLTGKIPTEVGNLNKLEGLFLSYNYLLGDIPSEIGRCTKLSTLSLYHNHLIGFVPRELDQLTKLNYLNIRENYYLDGSLPKTICKDDTEVYADCVIECCCCRKEFCLNILDSQSMLHAKNVSDTVLCGKYQ